MSLSNLVVLSAVFAILFLHCTSNNNNKSKTSPIVAESSQYAKLHCVNESSGVCAEFNVSYPIFSGGDTATVTALNRSVQQYLLSAVGGNGQLPFVQSLDSAAWHFVQSFVEEQQENPDREIGYAMEIKDTIPFLNAKVATVQFDGYAYTGGAHPSPFGILVSYDLTKKAHPLCLADMVTDTNALRPLLEKAYKISKGLQADSPLAEATYPDMEQLPMPANVGLVAAGIRFYYNAYEVAPYALGDSDILLTWDQLGSLADPNKWLEQQ